MKIVRQSRAQQEQRSACRDKEKSPVSETAASERSVSSCAASPSSQAEELFAMLDAHWKALQKIPLEYRSSLARFKGKPSKKKFTKEYKFPRYDHFHRSAQGSRFFSAENLERFIYWQKQLLPQQPLVLHLKQNHYCPLTLWQANSTEDI